MKSIGLIGGLTYVSTIEYYRHLNEISNQRLGGNETAEIIVYSVNFGEIKKLTENGDWKQISVIMGKAARSLEQAGAGCLMIGANTMHNVAGEIQDAVSIPLIHIADAVAEHLNNSGIRKTALLGTRYTMQLPFYKDYLSRNGIETIIPGEDDVNYLNRSIYDEFSKNIFLPQTKNKYLEIIEGLSQQGAEGAILGCTEIPILLKNTTCNIPLFDTSAIHAAAAVDFILR